ncbi:Uncharacterized N-terminal domain of lipid-A-disaccharide synthase [Hymenobacter gelipurpurascens]|uniref:Uncharacterized N-terminal domain of lipid-A-disaccharide synthase n=1 Tax=Hymenobacter gelipurpurascens TaxID=89968 RepID=A0A212TAL1_9BACT|nr:lipid-A-disaccharide synthase N-terminal domain-containing protein [Hymenobacter gelipurpurascens]SNC63083.1 Uncharacterized N-terminal domain of lipid-A-disaccharide synthase [Hymenobacter gelipurpurascens]
MSTELVARFIGLLSQGLFSSRIILQWIKSERAKQVLVPALFWQISLISSFLMIIYGILRHDPVILGAQLISYGIYIRNLQLLGEWNKLNAWFRAAAYAFPLATLVLFFVGTPNFSFQRMLHTPIPGGWLVLGALGQVVFLLRFVYQWLYSERKGESVLPLGFWVVSLVGSFLVLIYAILRRDEVLILGNVPGMVVYTRNIVLLRREQARQHTGQVPVA